MAHFSGIRCRREVYAPALKALGRQWIRGIHILAGFSECDTIAVSLITILII